MPILRANGLPRQGSIVLDEYVIMMNAELRRRQGRVTTLGTYLKGGRWDRDRSIAIRPEAPKPDL